MLWSMCSAHMIALSDESFDVAGKNDGWSSFFNDFRKEDGPNCRECHSSLIKQLRKYKSGLIDLGEINKCYKVIAEVNGEKPISQLMDAMKYYYWNFGCGPGKSKVVGKFGGYLESGSKILLFYERTLYSVNKRLDELEVMVKDNILDAMIFVEKGCFWMKDYIYVSGPRSSVRNPEEFLRRLNC